MGVPIVDVVRLQAEVVRTDLVQVARTGDVVHVRLHRPDRHNALLPEMWQGLARLGAELVGDESLKCAVIAGNGASFSSGLDRAALAAGALTPESFTGDPADAGRTEFRDGDIAAAQAVARWLHDGDFVSIAAVRGFTFGAGAQITFACDLRIVGTDTTFGLPEVEIGLFPEMTAVALLPGIIGYDKALEIGLTARRFDAAEADRLGLVTRLVEPDEVLPTATALAEKIAALRPVAVHSCKRAMRLGAAGDVDGALGVARRGGLQLLGDLVTGWDRP